jgi:hypothetical protein
MDTFETKAGRTLTLKPVKQTMLRALLHQFGGLRNIVDDPDRIRNLKGNARLRVAETGNQLFNYCAGFGVTTDPTEEEIDELAELGFRVDKPHLTRVKWLRLLLEDDEEAGELMTAVMLLTVQGVKTEEEEDEPDTDEKDDRIAALEAQLAAIEGETKEEDGG